MGAWGDPEGTTHVTLEGAMRNYLHTRNLTLETGPNVVSMGQEKHTIQTLFPWISKTQVQPAYPISSCSPRRQGEKEEWV